MADNIVKALDPELYRRALGLDKPTEQPGKYATAMDAAAQQFLAERKAALMGASEGSPTTQEAGRKYGDYQTGALTEAGRQFADRFGPQGISDAAQGFAVDMQPEKVKTRIVGKLDAFTNPRNPDYFSGDAVMNFAGGIKGITPKAKALEMARYHPSTVYHGTNVDFPEFLDAQKGVNTQNPLATVGHWSTTDNPLAVDFARRAAREGGDPLVKELRVRADSKYKEIDVSPEDSEKALAATILGLWDDGFDLVKVNGYRGPDGQVTDAFVAKNPSQYRDTKAAFDPKKRKSALLTAGIGGIAALGSQSDESE
jgi:hypothetical protein